MRPAAAPCAALLGSVESGRASLVFAQAEGLPHDIPGLLREAVEGLGGKGGGSRAPAQGGGPETAALDDVLARAAARARG